MSETTTNTRYTFASFVSTAHTCDAQTNEILLDSIHCSNMEQAQVEKIEYIHYTITAGHYDNGHE